MTSRAPTIAREDFRRLAHARTAQVTFVLVAVLVGLFGKGSVSSGAITGSPAREAVLEFPSLFQPFLFVLAVALSFDAVVGERESATLRLLLALPGTRRDVLVGKLLARVTAVALALLSILAILAALVVVEFGRLPVAPFVAVVGWVLLYGAAWTAFAVGVSAALASRFRVLASLVATYLLVTPLAQFWPRIVEPTAALVVTGSFSDEPFGYGVELTPEWARYVQAANPVLSFRRTGRWLAMLADGGRPAAPPGPILFSVLVVVLLGVVPVAVGLRRFEGADLGGGDAASELRGALAAGSSAIRRWVSRFPGVGFGSRSPTSFVRTRLPRGTWTDPGPSRRLLVARHEFREVRRNPFRVAAVGLVAAVVASTYWQVVGGTGHTVGEDLRFLPFLLSRFGVVLAVAVGYGAVAGDRETGTLRLLLGLPATRRDVLVGTLLARVGMAVAVFGSLLAVLGGILAVKPAFGAQHHVGGGYGPLPVGALVLVAGLVVLYGVAWTALTVAASAALSTRYRALAAVLAAYLLFDVDNGLWTVLVEPLLAALFTGSPEPPAFDAALNGTGPLWYVYAERLNPTIALVTTAEWVVSLAEPGPPVTGAAPVLFSLVALVLLGVVSVVAGYRRFDRADLG